jgi:hypothetical protein
MSSKVKTDWIVGNIYRGVVKYESPSMQKLIMSEIQLDGKYLMVKTRNATEEDHMNMAIQAAANKEEHPWYDEPHTDHPNAIMKIVIKGQSVFLLFEEYKKRNDIR